MSLGKERISILLEVYTSKTATAEQEQELMEWIHEATEDSELKDYMQTLWDKYQPESDRNNMNWNSMFEAIMQKDKVHLIAPEPKRIHWTRVAAAAVIILLLSLGGYFYFNNKSEKQIAKTEIQQQNDVAAPQTNKAVLTLSDGSRIVLDSAGNGSLAVQGNVDVIKTADGQVVYKGDATEIKYNTLTVPKGSKPVQLQLADGSTVWLNVASSITFPTAFINKERKVQITGEAYFEVAHNAAMPFIVQQNDISVQVLGTHFNVNGYDDEASMKITLLEGSINVTQGVKARILEPGQQARLVNNEIKVAKANIEEVMAWKNGTFSFNRTDISSIMREMARWYNVDVVFENNEVKGKDFTGAIARKENASEVLKMLEMTGVIHFTIEGKKIIVRK